VKRVIGADTETTGVNVKSEFILEVGAATLDITRKQIVEFYSKFLKWSPQPTIPQAAYDLHGIDNKLLEERGVDPQEVFSQLFTMFEQGDYICGHNYVDFDKRIIESNVLRIGNDALSRRFYALPPIIDTMTDLPFPKHIKVRSLTYLAFEHKFIQSNAHRALFDVFASLHLLGCYDFGHVVEISQTPTVVIRANLSYQDRDLAKQNGFFWNSDAKQWQKKVKEYFLNDFRKQLTFDIENTL
jgi:DNA polymerase-3 subunit epsilon